MKISYNWLKQYIDTDLSTAQCGGGGNCDARGVFTVSKSF